MNHSSTNLLWFSSISEGIESDILASGISYCGILFQIGPNFSRMIDPWSIGSQRKLEVLVIRRASADILCLRTTEGCWSPPVSHRDLAFHNGYGGGVRRRRVFLEDGGSYGL
ncbi:unnamed protein product [Brassica oleracea var. botrytis]|uniref:(rape) hypothetical protein n=1 Tax=Brassica napus TaxID=3708 RepID=A0A816IB22_BRANA|nr:unnamed protein product [Brassica napus]